MCVCPSPCDNPSPWQSPQACPHPIPSVTGPRSSAFLHECVAPYRQTNPLCHRSTVLPPHAMQCCRGRCTPPLLPRADRRPRRRPAPPPATRSGSPPSRPPRWHATRTLVRSTTAARSRPNRRSSRRRRPPPRSRSRRRTRRPMPGRRAPRRPAARPCSRSSRRRRPPPRSRSRRRTRRPTPGRRAHRLGSMCGRALITASSLNRGQLCGCHHAVPNRRWPQQPLIRKEA